MFVDLKVHVEQFESKRTIFYNLEKSKPLKLNLKTESPEWETAIHMINIDLAVILLLSTEITPHHLIQETPMPRVNVSKDWVICRGTGVVIGKIGF